MKVGLVLSGGGAKGAYQAGVVAALAEHKIEVQMISGASIGALNGAIVSASNSMESAAERLALVWEQVASQRVIKFNPKAYPRYIALLTAAGLSGINRVAYSLLVSFSRLLPEYGLLDDNPLTSTLARFLKPEDLATGRPLYVSLYPYKGSISAGLDLIKGAGLQRFETRESIFKHVQELNISDQREVILASAALPVLFTPRKVGGQPFTDGGQGNYRNVQGNTPITPLLGKNLDAIIVSHLSDGSFWDANDFPDEAILEIRPSTRISEKGAADMLGFSADNIRKWIGQGRRDTDTLLRKVSRLSSAREELRLSAQSISDSLPSVQSDLKNPALEVAMDRLKRSVPEKKK